MSNTKYYVWALFQSGGQVDLQGLDYWKYQEELKRLEALKEAGSVKEIRHGKESQR